MSEIVAVTINTATKLGVLAQQWRESCLRYGYTPVMLGANVKWEGFRTKMQLYIAFLETQVPEQVCVLTDCWDFVFTDVSSEMLRKYKATKKPMVVGVEVVGVVGAHLMHFFSNGVVCDLNPGSIVNSGFLLGTVSFLLPCMRKCLDLCSYDDQIALGQYVNLNPALFHIDTDREIIYHCSIFDQLRPIFRDGHFEHPTTNKRLCAIHFPFPEIDLGKRNNFVRSCLFQDWSPHKTTKEWKVARRQKMLRELVSNQAYSPILLTILLVFLVFLFCVVAQKNKIH